MTEAEWLASDDPAAMLAELSRSYKGASFGPGKRVHAPPSDRKLRLFACACCRQVWDGHVCVRCDGGQRGYGKPGGPFGCADCNYTGRIGGLTDPRSRRAVETAERFADGEATEEEIAASVPWGAEPDSPANRSALGVSWYGPMPAEASVRDVLRLTADAGLPPAAQAALLRCIFGSPWRSVTLPKKTVSLGKVDMVVCGHRGKYPAVVLEDHSWLAWQDGTIPKLAAAIYRERAFTPARLAVLADALAEAGCEDAAILAHLAGPGPHARGCWVIDLLLGKE